MIKEINDRYLIDTLGNVHSIKRNGTKGGILKPTISSNGYYVVMLSPSRKPTKVHRLVAEAFIPNDYNKPFINHIDGNKLNNTIDNLEWCTSKENAIHAHRIGLAKPKRGVNNSQAKLTIKDVEYIRSSYVPRSIITGARALAREFSVSHTVILDVLSHKSY